MKTETRDLNQVVAHKRELASRILTLRAKVARYTQQLEQAEKEYQNDEKFIAERTEGNGGTHE